MRLSVDDLIPGAEPSGKGKKGKRKRSPSPPPQKHGKRKRYDVSHLTQSIYQYICLYYNCYCYYVLHYIGTKCVIKLIIVNSRITKRRENEDDEDDQASRDNTDAAPTPEAERSSDSKCIHIVLYYDRYYLHLTTSNTCLRFQYYKQTKVVNDIHGF